MKLTLTFTCMRNGSRQICRRKSDKAPGGTFADIEQGWVLNEVETLFASEGTNFPRASFYTGYDTVLWGIKHWTSISCKI